LLDIYLDGSPTQGRIYPTTPGSMARLSVGTTLDGECVLDEDDWVVQETNGDLIVVKPADFSTDYASD
jgi:hypothetical protein